MKDNRKRKDTFEDKKAKKEGKYDRDTINRNPSTSQPTKCRSCGQSDHASSRSQTCPHHRLSINEKAQLVLGSHREHFIRRIPFNSVVREKYQDQLRNKINHLSSFIRQVVLRAQVFVNGYIIDHAQDPISPYIYSQQFWYSVCQLVMSREVTNTNTNLSTDIKDQWAEFIGRYPSATYPLSGFKGYSDALSSACQVLSTVYTNHMVENFELYFTKYCKHVLQRSDSVSCQPSHCVGTIYLFLTSIYPEPL